MWGVKRTSEPALPRSGQMIEGYRDFTPVAHGGSSTVYTAYQETFDRTVAVKVFHADLRDARAERRFTRECKLTGRLGEHPEIITCYGAGATRDRRPYIAMQYFPRGSAADQIRNEGPLGVPETLRIGQRIAGALDHAHREGVFHRDVKPGNILLTNDGEAVLSDFGVAGLAFGAGDPSTSEAFTPVYAAPEILRGEEPSAASDVYGLGATLYALLAGRAPFAGSAEDGPAQILLRILAGHVPPLPRDDVPAPMLDLLHAMLANEIGDRPRSAAQVQQEISILRSRFGAGPPPRGGDRYRSAGDRGADAPPAADFVPPWTFGEPGVDDTRVRRRPASPPHATRQSEQAALDPAGRRARWPLIVFGAVTVVIVLLGVAVLLAPPQPPPLESGKSLPAAPQPTVSLDSLSAAEINAAAPQDVDLSDHGDTVLVTWKPGTGHAFFVITVSTDGEEPKAIPVSGGDSSHLVEALDPSRPYCFAVVAVLRPGPNEVVAPSPPACVRAERATGS